MNHILTTTTFLFFSFTLASFAANDNNNTGAASAGMGNASVSLSDIWSAGNNQAGLAYQKNIAAGIYYDNKFLLKELSHKVVVAAIPVKKGTIGFTTGCFGYKNYKENKYGLAFSKAFRENFSAGVQIDYLTTYIAEGYGIKRSAVAEAGILSKPIKNLTIGAHIYNISRTKLNDYSNERIPIILRIGGNYKFSGKTIVAIDAEKNIDQPLQFKMGFEYMPVKDFFIRGGISTNPSKCAFGFGFKIKNTMINIASSYHSVVGFTPALDISYNFSKRVF